MLPLDRPFMDRGGFTGGLGSRTGDAEIHNFEEVVMQAVHSARLNSRWSCSLALVLSGLLAAPNLAQAQQVQNGPTKEQLQQAGGKVVIAIVADRIADEAAKGPNAGPGDIFAAQVARGVRDAAIESALRDLFPRLSARQRRDIRLLTSNAVDGRLNLLDQTQQKAKQRLINDLRDIDENLADAAVLADFIYWLHQTAQMQ